MIINRIESGELTKTINGINDYITILSKYLSVENLILNLSTVLYTFIKFYEGHCLL